MVRLSEFIDELNSMKKEHGDLPVVSGPILYGEILSVDRDEPIVKLYKAESIDGNQIKHIDSILIA